MPPSRPNSGCKYLVGTLWWCIFPGLLLPRTPQWGWLILVCLIPILLVSTASSFFKKTKDKSEAKQAIPPGTGAGLISGAVTISVVIRHTLLRATQDAPPGLVAFIFFTLVSVWAWFEFAWATGLKLKSLLPYRSIYVLIVNASLIGLIAGMGVASEIPRQVPWILCIWLLLGGLLMLIPAKIYNRIPLK